MIFLSSIVLYFLSSHAADLSNYAGQRCGEEQSRAQDACSFKADVTKSCAAGMAYCYMYTGCNSPISNILITSNNIPRNGNQPGYQNCSISKDDVQGSTHQEIATGLGTGLKVDVMTDGLTTTTIVTPDGQLICTQKDPNATNYDECHKVIKDRSQPEKTSVVSYEVMNQLFFKKARLDQAILAPTPMPRPLNRAKGGDPVSQ